MSCKCNVRYKICKYVIYTVINSVTNVITIAICIKMYDFL